MSRYMYMLSFLKANTAPRINWIPKKWSSLQLETDGDGNENGEKAIG